MPKLPTVGGDTGIWGSILNEFLLVSHNSSGGLNTDSVGTDQLQNTSVTKTKLASSVQSSLDLADNSAQKSANSSDQGKAIDAYTGNPLNVSTESINSVAAAGASQTLPDISTATVHRLVLNSASCTLTFPAAAAGKGFTLLLVQDATGSRTVTWPGSILWASGVVPVLTSTANKQDLFTFICIDGTNWLGMASGQGF